MFLDDHPSLEASVGYGELGRHGQLGYEGKAVLVRGTGFAHALSAHAPSRLRVPLSSPYRSFSCQVALNEDLPGGESWADFHVRVDGHVRGQASHVRRGEPPRSLEVSVDGGRELELVVETTRWEHCHSVWLEPRLSEAVARTGTPVLEDPLRRAEILVPSPLPRAERCIATVVSAGFEPWLEGLLSSLAWRGGVPEAQRVVLAVEAGPACERIARAHGAVVIPCRRRAALNATVKSVLYSIARLVDARQFVCLDADMLVVGSLAPLFALLDAAPPDAILACREANGHGLRNLDHAIHAVYGGRPTDLQRIMGSVGGEGGYGLPVNDGLFAGNRTALLALDGLLRLWPAAAAWTDERRDVWWRNQFVFNLALAKLNCGVELDPVFNVQLNSQDVALSGNGNGSHPANWRGRPVRVLHFNGQGRHKYAPWRAEFLARSRPMHEGNTHNSPDERVPASAVAG